MRFKPLVIDTEKKTTVRRSHQARRLISLAAYGASEGYALHVRFGKAKLAKGPDGAWTLPDDGGAELDFTELSNIFCIQSVRKALMAEATAAGVNDRPRLYLLDDEQGRLKGVVSGQGLFSDMTGINLLRGNMKQAFCGRNKRLAKVMYERHPYRGGLCVYLHGGIIDPAIEGYTRDGGAITMPGMIYDVKLMSLDELLLEATKAGNKVYWPSWYIKWAVRYRPDIVNALKAMSIVADMSCTHYGTTSAVDDDADADGPGVTAVDLHFKDARVHVTKADPVHIPEEMMDADSKAKAADPADGDVDASAEVTTDSDAGIEEDDPFDSLLI